jgi:hypothetical protein
MEWRKNSPYVGRLPCRVEPRARAVAERGAQRDDLARHVVLAVGRRVGHGDLGAEAVAIRRVGVAPAYDGHVARTAQVLRPLQLELGGAGRDPLGALPYVPLTAQLDQALRQEAGGVAAVADGHAAGSHLASHEAPHEGVVRGAQAIVAAGQLQDRRPHRAPRRIHRREHEGAGALHPARVAIEAAAREAAGELGTPVLVDHRHARPVEGREVPALRHGRDALVGGGADAGRDVELLHEARVVAVQRHRARRAVFEADLAVLPPQAQADRIAPAMGPGPRGERSEEQEQDVSERFVQVPHHPAASHTPGAACNAGA